MKINSKPFHIAIDGPVAAGKGTISRLTAERLNFLYVDTGAMYRMAALLCYENNIEIDDEKQAVQFLAKVKMEIRNPTEEEKDGRLSTILLDDEDVSWKIRTELISQGASKISTLPLVRQILVKKQQKIAAKQNVVMEGRDITYRVLPNADLKIFLTANEIVRAKRRHLQLLTKGIDIDFQQVYQELLERDQRDSHRQFDPLKIVDSAWVIDTSDLSIEKVVEIIVTKAEMMMKK